MNIRFFPGRGLRLSLGLVMGVSISSPGIVSTLPAAALELPPPALAIKVCVNGLLYRNIFADGTPGGPSTGITQTDAAIACRGVGSLTQARQTKLCVNGLLFTQVTEDGFPAGPSTGITSRNAAIACSIPDSVRRESAR
jgi:hypothetical protein